MNVIESWHLFAMIWILAGAGLSVAAGKLNPAGAFTGTLLAAIIYFSGGFTGLGMLTAFFVVATAATSWRKQEKQKATRSDIYQTKRNANQVLANAAIPAICGLLIIFFPVSARFLLVMMSAGLASATADTLSSELGMIYGRRFYNVLSLKREENGRDGLVSWEGTIAGLVGSIIIAAIFYISYPDISGFWAIGLSGVTGNLFDSILGASVERKGYLQNDAVNFLNTLFAAVISVLLYSLML